MFKVLALLAMLVISCVPTPELKDVQKSNTTDQQLTPSEATDQSHHLKIPGPAILNTIIPGKNSAVLAWSADPEWGSVTSYNLRYNFVPDLTQSVLISNISSPYVFSNLMPNRNYYIQIEAVNSFGKSVSDVHNFKTSIDPPGLILIEQVVAAQTQAEISWSIESSGGQVATLFLEYSQSSDFANSTIVSQNISSPYTLTGLQANTTYFFRVKAENQAGSTQSIAEVFTTLENPPVAPILSPVVAQQTAALLSWSLSTASSSTTKYTVRYGQNAQLANAEVQENIMTTQFNLTGLAPNTQYYYQVIAINSVGEAASAIVGFQTLAPPANAPNILQTTNITASSATLNYSPNAISGAPSSYRIRFSTTPNSFSGNGQSTTQTQFTLTGLQMNTTYYFEVAAMYSNATPSATGSFVTDFTAPLAPNLGTVSTLATSAVINWTSGGGGPTDSYTVRYSLFENMNSFQQVPNITSLSTTLNNLNANTKYYYRVIATNTKGSASSIVKDFTTQNIAPSAPTSLAASVVNSSTANLSWSGGSGGGVATSFNLIYATNAQLNNPIEVPGVTSPHQLSGLQANTVYYFRIKAINSADSTESSTQSFATNGLAPVAQVITDIIDITTNSAKVTWQNAPNPSQNSFQNTLFPVMQNRCASCHNVAQYSTSAHGSSNPSVAHDAMFFVDSQNRKKVDFNNTSLSRLVTKPMENHACGSACATEILNGINNWKNQGGGTVGVASSFRVEFSENSNFSNATPVNNANSPATLSGLSEGKTYHVRVVAINSSSSTNSVPMNFNTLSMSSGGGSSPIDYNINLRVGDRRYVDSVLRDIFNLNSDSNGGSSIRQQIYENPVFGGGCDKYSEVTISGYTIENPQERCFTGMWVSDLVNFNPMRAASMSKTCNTIVNNTTARNAAFQKIFGSTTAGAITDETFMNKAYQLFYPEELPTSEIRTALIALGNTSSSNTDKWRNVLYGLCVSPEWQTLY